MSDIMVKQLAKTVGASVDMLLKQLQDAGISVSGADASISNTQKIKLLKHIQGLKKTSPTQTNLTGKSKLALKRRDTSNAASSKKAPAGKTAVNIVRRKKVAAKKPVTTAPTPARTAPPIARQQPMMQSRSAILAQQLDAERKARLQVSAPQAGFTRIKTKSAATVAKATKEKAASKVLKNTQATAATAAASKATQQKTTAQTATSVQKSDKTTISSKISTQGVADTSKVSTKTGTAAKPKTSAQPQLRKQASPSKPVRKPNVVKKTTEPVKPSTVKANPKVKPTLIRPSAPSQARPTLTSRLSLLNLGGGLAHREAVAAKARQEASSLLKVRPSRKPKVVAKPVVKPAVEKKVVKATPAKTADKKAEDKKKQPKRLRNAGGPMHLAGNKSKAKRRGKRARRQPRNVQIDDTKHQFEKPTAPVVHEIEIPEMIVVGDLAKELKVQGIDVIKVMMGMGVMATINQTLDQDTAILVVEEMGHKAKPLADVSDEALVAKIIEDDEDYETVSRPPVVTIMGHVDHGKTSLLDYIRKSRVTAGEAGGITQHIGAYHVETDNGVISFLDTPGHAAFSEMRARGANATDIVIVVVAADDGVMPQTKEAIEHTRAAGVPMIVAVNKVDKETADPDRVKNELSQFDVIPEDWGGDDVFVNVSAHSGEGIDSLLENISLVAEMLELKAPIEGAAKGVVVEASIEKGRGAVATVMVQSGTLKRGDFILSGKEYGRVRALFNEYGKPVKTAGPSIPVSVLGLSGAPMAGDKCLVVADERKAKEIAEARRQQEKDSLFAAQQAAKLDAMFSKMKGGEVSEVPVLLKADVQGSIEALKSSLLKLSTDEVVVKIISSGVGGFNETDVNLAIAAGASMIGFNVRADASAKRIASESGAEIRYYSIIYEIIDDIRDAMSGLLSPELREEFVGLAEVKEVFRSSSFGAAAGCLVMDGNVKQGLPIRVLRDNVVVFEGELESLRRHKDLVNEVISGTECGIAVKNYSDIQEGDQIECFKRIEVAREL